MYKKIVIGIDQSYTRTGITVGADGKRKSGFSIDFKGCNNNTEKRSLLGVKLIELMTKLKGKAEVIVVVVERIRLISGGVLSEDYIKATGALIARIIDVSNIYGIKVYSVATNSWKSKVVGTIKPKANKYEIDPKKYNTILFIKKEYPEVFKSALIPASKTKRKGVIEIDGERYTINDDLCDSTCIMLYAFLPEEEQLLDLEVF